MDFRFEDQEQSEDSDDSSAGPMPSATISDKDRFMCIAYLLNDVGPKVLRQLFHDMVTPTCTLDQYLANNRSKINSLVKKKVLNVSQIDIMFPPNGDPTSLTDYDITLLSALFNNIMPSLGHQEKNLIKSLRDNRNKLYVHTKSCKMNASDFQTCWSDISSTLITLSQQCVDTKFKNEISMEIQQTQVPDASYLSVINTLYRRIKRLESNKTSTIPLLPVEILSMDSNSIQLYKKALQAGMEKVYNIRVMVVGQSGVGKTTLIKRLLGQWVDISERKCTEGIDVHKHCCKISLDTGEWIQQVEDSDQLYILHRLNKVLSGLDQKPDISQEQDGIEIDQVQSSTQLSITNLDKETSIVAVPLSDAKSSESEEKKTKDAMMEILRLVNEKADKLVKDIEKYAALSFWDFAGQYAFYTTHQMFLTSRAIYLLVIDLSQQITDPIQNDRCFLDADGIKLREVLDLLHIWMNSILSCVPSPEAIIPVILVGTHVDKLSEKSLKKEDIDKYFIDLQCMLGEPTIHHLHSNIAIDNTQPDPMLEELKRRIFKLSKLQPHWGEEKPARWLPLEQAIMTLKASGTKIVPLSLIEEINMSGSVKIEDRKELKLFLKFHHEMGTILYFSVKELREKIVLDPQWMIDALKSLITAETFVSKHPAISIKYRDFVKTGKLTHELIDAIWTKEDNPEFHNHKDHILSLMEELNIIAKPRIFSEEGKETKEEPYFLAPCILQQKMPEEIISPKLNSQMEESSPVLCYVFTGNFLPSAIFHRLVAACIAHWEVAKKMKEHREENLIFCGCCVFKLKKNHQLTLHFRQHVIFLRVTRMGIKDKTPSSKLCIEVREFITTNLEKIIGYLGKGLKFEYSIQCPEYNGVSINSLIPLSRLKEEEEVCCEFDHMKDDHMINKHIIKSCKVLDFWFEDQEQTVMEGIEEGKESKVSEKGEDASMDRVLSTSIKKEKLHMTVLNRCLPRLLECLDVKVVMIYIQQEELFDPVTTRDINEQTTTTAQILCLIEQIKKRDQHTYVRFKECLIRAQQGHLKRMLDEKEENLVAEMKEKHQEKLHWTVLNRCLPNLMKDLNVQDVMMYIQQKELLDDLTLRDISEQTTTTDKISHLIDQIKKRDQDTYVRFKECLILAKRADLKIMLEEEEKNIAAEMKEKHQVKKANIPGPGRDVAGMLAMIIQRRCGSQQGEKSDASWCKERIG